MALHVGLGTVSGQVPPWDERPVADVYADVLSLAGVAEEAGFDAFWVSEHHGAADSHIPSPLVVLAAVAVRTRRIALGTAVAVAPFQDPIRFAEDCAVVDQLSRGRLIVGVAAGWRQEEFDAFGVPLAERAARTAELVRRVRAGWDGPIAPKPYRRIPLLLGGGSRAAAARAGRMADGFIAGPQTDPEAFRVLVEAFDVAARDAGRDPSRLMIGCQLVAWVSADGAVSEEVRRAIWHKMGTSRRWHAGSRVRTAADLPPLDDAAVRARTFSGTPAELAARLEPWVRAFAGRELHLIVKLTHAGLPLAAVAGAVRTFGESVVPALRGMAA